MLFDELASASENVASTTKRTEKVAVLAAVLSRLAPSEVVAAAAFLVGTTPLGRVGVGWATLADVRSRPADTPSLSVADVDSVFRRLDAAAGPGVAEERRTLLGGILSAATGREQRLIRGIVSGELRQGALGGVLTTAVAQAAGVPVAAVRRAAMMTGDLGEAALIALTAGRVALDSVSLRPSRPVQPMLASPSADVASAMKGAGRVQVDWKLDGIRVQAHRRGDDVSLFTRNLNDITERLPGVVDLVRSLPGGDLVLDGEAMGLHDDGAPQRFQDTMRRATGLRAFFFDVLHLDGESVHDEALSVRRELLAGTVPEASRLPSIVTADAVEAEAFLQSAVVAGHEGVMVKDLDQPYAAGRRGTAWRKVKPVHTLDLVVLAVEWGHGRRRGLLSNIHLGARDPDDAGSFVMVGKTFKGMTDEMLRWQTARFRELEVGDGPVAGRLAVHLRPEQVVEIAVDGVQVSTTYPGGVALRFARVRRYRSDKVAGDADTIDAVRALVR